ncbi:hypothetical protein BH10PSE19_BH10PSE19_23050 [soil metagenome]
MDVARGTVLSMLDEIARDTSGSATSTRVDSSRTDRRTPLTASSPALLRVEGALGRGTPTGGGGSMFSSSPPSHTPASRSSSAGRDRASDAKTQMDDAERRRLKYAVAPGGGRAPTVVAPSSSFSSPSPGGGVKGQGAALHNKLTQRGSALDRLAARTGVTASHAAATRGAVSQLRSA